MEQLTGADTSFLAMEDAHQFGHVSSLNIFDPSDRPGGAGYEATRQLLVERMHLLQPFRRRLVEVPFGLDHPYWIEDPDFDLDFHLRHIAIPPPGDDEQLGQLVSRLIARPLDRSRPLWELYIIEGLRDGRVGQLTKIHHATIDGASGAQMLVKLLDADPDGSEVPPPTTPIVPEPVPTQAELLRRTMTSLALQPRKVVRLQVNTLRSLAATTRSDGLAGLADLVARGLPGPLGEPLRRRRNEIRRQRERNEGLLAPVMPAIAAPPTPWNAAIGTHRRYAFDTLSLSDAKEIKNALGCTLNDVVMALTAGVLRNYLLKHGSLPDAPLIAMVPVSIRTEEEAETYSNRVSAIFAPLATDVEDPVERARRISEAMVGAKQTHNAVPAALLQDFSQFATPAIATLANRLIVRTRLADRVNSPINVVISNVPGPRHPLYSAGARLEHFYPVSTIVDGIGLNVTVQSYLDNLDFGLVADRDLVPDLWYMMGLFHEELDALRAAAKG